MLDLLFADYISASEIMQVLFICLNYQQYKYHKHVLLLEKNALDPSSNNQETDFKNWAFC